ncbi:MAG: ABC transporter substrate-binding protein [Bifidobacteriaceae bacterium]|jgi:alpha-glucoside transport system substrate-binding protein|nr:ABC transporter substrate-binding protein [Bifidobacteriaceae bacterium]
MKRSVGKVVMAASMGLALAAGMAACGNSDNNANSGSNTSGGDDASVGAKPDCAAYEKYGDLSGKSIGVYTTFVDAEGASYEESFKDFTECTGAEIKYEGSKSLTGDVLGRIEAGAVADIVAFPQPGLLQQAVATGKVLEAPADVAANVDQYWTASWRAYGSVDGKLYAAPLGASVKSLVWYSPSAFTEGGYEVPETWDDLLTLTKTIADDGAAKPWCAGIADGEATGWVATDWVEDMVLRSAGPDAYDQWVNHEIPFNDAKIVDSLKEMSKVLRDDAYVNAGIGDIQSIAATAWTDAGTPILDGQCYLHRQASFYGGNFADEGAKVAEDGDIWAFYLPSTDPTSKPILGGGDFVAAFADRPEVVAFQTFLSSPEWANAKAKVTEGGWTTANNGLEKGNLKSPVDQLAYGLLADPSAEFRFDGSDLMPAAVGSDAFWKEMTAYFAENKPEQAVADAIEAAWPK